MGNFYENSSLLHKQRFQKIPLAFGQREIVIAYSKKLVPKLFFQD